MNKKFDNDNEQWKQWMWRQKTNEQMNNVKMKKKKSIPKMWEQQVSAIHKF